MAMNDLSALIEGRSKIADSRGTTIASLPLSRILGWVLLALHCVFLPKLPLRGSYHARLVAAAGRQVQYI